MISRYDEVMAQKANKTSLIGVEVKCKEIFVKKEDLAEQSSSWQATLDTHGTSIDKLNQTMELLNANLTKDIHTAVRKVAKQMESTAQKRKQPIKNNFNMPTSKRGSISQE